MELIYGDNQFLGVNHGSALKAKVQQQNFAVDSSVLELLFYCEELGVKSFSYTCTHRMNEILKQYYAAGGRMKLCPTLPYAHTYAQRLGENGPVGLAKFLLPRKKTEVCGLFLDLLINRDYTRIFEAIIKSEVNEALHDYISTIYLNNIFTDFILCDENPDLFTNFKNAVIKTIPNARAGLMTLNFPRLASTIRNTDNLVLCSYFNPLGFRMNPSKIEAEHALTTDLNVQIMAPFCAGAVTASEFIEYLNHTNYSFSGVIFGSGNKDRIGEFVESVHEYNDRCTTI